MSIATVSGLLVIVALAVLASVATLGLVLRDHLANRPARQAIAFQSDVTTNATVIRRFAAMAALVLGIQVVAACGTENASTDTVDPGAPIEMVQAVGSADSVERRAAAVGGNRVGSADAIERRLAVERGGACVTSADAAERLGHAPCVD